MALRRRASIADLQEWTLGRTCCLLAHPPSLVPPTPGCLLWASSLPPPFSSTEQQPHSSPHLAGRPSGSPPALSWAALAGVWFNPRILTAPLHRYDTWQITDSSSRMDGWTGRPGDRASICWGLGWVFFFSIQINKLKQANDF